VVDQNEATVAASKQQQAAAAAAYSINKHNAADSAPGMTLECIM
jgi:hypothetical protein